MGRVPLLNIDPATFLQEDLPTSSQESEAAYVANYQCDFWATTRAPTLLVQIPPAASHSWTQRLKTVGGVTSLRRHSITLRGEIGSACGRADNSWRKCPCLANCDAVTLFVMPTASPIFARCLI